MKLSAVPNAALPNWSTVLIRLFFIVADRLDRHKLHHHRLDIIIVLLSEHAVRFPEAFDKGGYVCNCQCLFCTFKLTFREGSGPHTVDVVVPCDLKDERYLSIFVDIARRCD